MLGQEVMVIIDAVECRRIQLKQLPAFKRNSHKLQKIIVPCNVQYKEQSKNVPKFLNLPYTK